MRFLVPITYTTILAGMLIVNFLANYLPLNGKGTGELSDQYESLITPAGPAFSIWGLIYIFLLGFVVKVWIVHFQNKEDAIQASRKLLPLFLFNGIFNIGWLFTWHYEMVNLSLVMMIGLLVSLIFIYLKEEELLHLLKAPFSVYLGWISVASIVNVSVVILHNNWVIGDPVFWTVGLIFIAIVLGLTVLILKKEWIFPLVIAWALYFIAQKNGDINSIRYAALMGMALMVISSLLLFFSRTLKSS